MPIKINGTNTAANPSITGDDTDTGIVYGSDQIDFSTGGSSKVTLNGSNLGINTISPNAQLEVKNTGNVKIYADSSGGYIQQDVSNLDDLHLISSGDIKYQSDPENDTTHTNHIFECDGSEKFRIDKSGNCGIGVSNPTEFLQIHESQNNTRSQITFTNNSTGASVNDGLNIGLDGSQNAIIHQHENTNLIFGTNDIERMRLLSGGDVVVGGTSANAQQAITLTSNASNGAGRINFNRANTTNVSIVLRMQNDGSQVGRLEHDHTGASLISGSDYRLKENDVAISDGIIRLKKLRPIRFNWKNEPSKTVDGFFAHEISSVVPEAVSGEKDAVDSDGNIIMQGISKERLVPLLTAALQEAVAKIEVLETKIAALEAA